MNDSTVKLEDAKSKAESELIKNIGNLPRLDEPREEDRKFIFPIIIRYPRVIFDEDKKNPLKVEYLSKQQVGQIKIDKDSGELERTKLGDIEREIRDKKDEIQEKIDRAIVRSAADEFSRLPFAEHRFAPVLDLLAKVIMEGEISQEELEVIDDSSDSDYLDYLEALVEVGLLRQRNDVIEAGNVLIEIEKKEDHKNEMMNSALAVFFKEGEEEYMEIVEKILGPYLYLASHYYYRALGIGELPSLREDELYDAIDKRYSPGQATVKKFKMFRYLFQLENVGILEKGETDRWKGNENIFQALYSEEFEESSRLMV